MKKNLLSVFLICLSFLSFSQSTSPAQYQTRQVGWSVSENFFSIQKTLDGGVIGINTQTKKYSEAGILQFTLPFAPKTRVWS